MPFPQGSAWLLASLAPVPFGPGPPGRPLPLLLRRCQSARNRRGRRRASCASRSCANQALRKLAPRRTAHPTANRSACIDPSVRRLGARSPRPAALLPTSLSTGRRLGVPIVKEDGLVVPDILGTAIKVTSSAFQKMPARVAPRGYSLRGRCCDLSIYRGPAVLRDLLHPALGFPLSDRSLWLQSVEGGCLATHCEQGKDP
jgi:hypothetical protein